MKRNNLLLKLFIGVPVILILAVLVFFDPPKIPLPYSNPIVISENVDPELFVDPSKLASDFKKRKNFENNLISELLKEIIGDKKENNNPKTFPSCGYQSCPTGKPGFINVHLVPHSHDDPGWLHTYEQYYSGESDKIKILGVNKIIDAIVNQLKLDPSRRFIYVEMAFFKRWWDEQNEEKRSAVRDLVANGQLEFVNGGWCMNDEATTHYVDIIDQMSLGLKFLNETFGECGRPRIAWQVDPFGHSKEHASLMAQMGFDGLIIGRIDYRDKEERRKSKTMEMVWVTNDKSGENDKLFTGVLFDSYDTPNDFCKSFTNSVNKRTIFPRYSPTIDDDYDDLDINKIMNEFLDYCQKHADSYKTQNIMIPMFGDFKNEQEVTCFTPMDQLIKYANKLQETGSKLNLFYSTPSCYVKAVNEQDVILPTKTDDFFPLASSSPFDPSDIEYWTGFFTSRPALKLMVRQGSNLLQSCKQMASYLSMKSLELVGNISVMKEAVALLQHHDAITGTEQQHVADDYAHLIQLGVEECQKIQNQFYQRISPKNAETVLPKVSFCNLNMSQCDITEGKYRFVVNVYNSLAWTTSKYIRVPVVKSLADYQIFNFDGSIIPSELVPIPAFIRNLPGRNSSATHELVFLASQLPPLGNKSYYVQLSEIVNIRKSRRKRTPISKRSLSVTISNERIIVEIDEGTGLIQSISIDGEVVELKQELLWYAGRIPGPLLHYKNKIKTSKKASGAYLFRPNQTDPFPVRELEAVSTSIYKGELVQEIHQSFNNWAGQTIRLYKGQDHVELDWVVGSIPIEDGVSKEVVSRFTTKLASKKEFYTDSNGRQILKRRIDSRESFELNITDRISGNYYPINSQIYIKDETKDKQLTILVDRAQGGASLRDGQLELMVHRRLLHDDDFGVKEPLNEVAYSAGLTVRGTHFLLLSGIVESAKLAQSLSQQIYKQPQISFISTELSFKEWSENYNTEMRVLNESLPENVNLLTLEIHSNGKYLIRLEHFYELWENLELTRSVTINLKSLFYGFTVTSAEETLLGGNQLKKDSKRLIWKEFNTIHQENQSTNEAAFDLEKIILYPKQIRSFILSVNKDSA